jgi:hypothetical protein
MPRRTARELSGQMSSSALIDDLLDERSRAAGCMNVGLTQRRLFSWGTVRWSRGCRDGGPGTRRAVGS